MVYVRALPSHPIDGRCGYGRPHQSKAWPERHGDPGGQHALHIEQDRHSRLVERRKDHLTDREGRVRVDEGRGFGPYDDGRQQRSPIQLGRIPLQTE